MLLLFNPKPPSPAVLIFFPLQHPANSCTEKVATTIPYRLWKYCMLCDIFPVHPHPSASTQSARNDTGFFCSKYHSFFPTSNPSIKTGMCWCLFPTQIHLRMWDTLLLSSQIFSVCEHLMKETGKIYLVQSPTWCCKKVSIWSLPNEGIGETLWKYFEMQSSVEMHVSEVSNICLCLSFIHRHVNPPPPVWHPYHLHKTSHTSSACCRKRSCSTLVKTQPTVWFINLSL